MVDNQKTEKLIKGISNLIVYKKGLITNDYILGPVLGSCSTQAVRQATNILTKTERAVKIFKKIDQDENKFLTEIEVLAKLSHPNLMQIFEIYDDSRNFYIVSELCSGGELFDKIIEKSFFSEKDASLIIKQILSAINYSHLNKIIHL